MAKVEDGSIESFRPQRRNLNKHSQRGMGALEASMRKHGYVAPMTAAADGEIIDGSARLETVANVFDDDVLIVHHDGTRPVVMVRDDIPDASTNEARAISGLANRIAEINLTWDAEELFADLQSGVEFGDAFNQEELDAMLAGLVAPEPVNDTPPDVSKADELRQKWNTSLGQLWSLGKHRLIIGDCTDAATVARLMQGEKAAMMFTDPPYGISFEGQLLSSTTVDGIQVNHHKGANTKHKVIENDALTGDALASFCFDFLESAKVAGIKAWYICFSQLDLDLLLSAMRKSGFEWRSIIAWIKNQATLSGKDYKLRYEPIVYGQSGGAFHGEHYHEEDVWEITRTLKNDLHPTMKPVDLVVRAVKNSSLSGDIVYEPFSGSGTCIIACEQLSRQCRAIELDAGYCAITLQRFYDATGQTPELIS